MSEKVEKYGQHIQSQRKRENEFAKKVRVKVAIEVGNEAITERNWYQLACIVRDKLAPELIGKKNVRDYDAELGGDDWGPAELNRFLTKSKQYIYVLAHGNDVSAAAELSYKQNGYQTPWLAARDTTKKAFKSLERIATHEDMVRDEMRNFVEARGYTLKMGRMWKSPKMYLNDPIHAISRDSGLTKTLFHGGTGQGKSTTLGTAVEDRYNINHPRRKAPSSIDGHKYEGQCKILDFLDFREGENMVYDIPQQDPVLRRLRRDADVPETFEDSDQLMTPELEIFIPLTPDLGNTELPYDTDANEFRTTPFTIPASSLSKPLLVSLMASMVSPQQETTIRTAYDTVDQNNDDWTLKDLAEEIMNRDDLGESYQKRVVSVLENLQNMGFIRDKTCPHALTRDKWMQIFEDTDTITSFSMAFMDEMVGKLMGVGYIVDVIDDIRTSEDVPDAALVGRELHKVAPHRGESSFDNQEESLQDVISSRLSLLTRENRHRSAEIIGDTQDILHLKKGFRKGFNRFVTFNTSDESLKELFAYTSSSNWKSCGKSLTVKKGEGAVVGQADPLVKRDDLDYLGHVEFLPPSWHHLDTDTEPSGWIARTNYLDHEELRKPSFKAMDAPDDLVIDERTTGGNSGVDTAMERFIDECIVKTGNGSDFEHTSAVRRAYNAWAHDSDQEQIQSPVSFGKEINKAIDSLEKKWRDGGQAYVGVRFNPLGQDYAK